MSWKLDRIAWVDVETTGVDPERDLLLEVALIVTTGNLHELARESLVIAHTAAEIDAALDREDRDPEVSAYVRQMHTDNGLLGECQGPWSVSAEEADERLAHLLGVQSEGERSPLGGCSLWIDRSMVRLHLPLTYELVSHRSVDASCLKLALVNWAGVEPKRRSRKASNAHRALGDCEDAIKLARSMKLHLQRSRRALEAERFELAAAGA